MKDEPKKDVLVGYYEVPSGYKCIAWSWVTGPGIDKTRVDAFVPDDDTN